MMTTSMNRRRAGWPAAVLMSLTLLIPLSGAAQEQEEQAAVAEAAISTAAELDVGERGAEILARMDRAIDDFGRYKDQLAASTPEDRLVLGLQQARAQDRFLKAMVELGDLITLSRDDATQAELVAKGKSVYVTVTPLVWNQIGALRRDIDSVRGGREDTPSADRAALEDDLIYLTERLDRLFSYGWSHVQNMEAFGLDAAAARDTLAGLLDERADEVSGRLDLASLRIRELTARLKDQPGDADLTLLLAANRKDLDTNIASQTGTLDIMDALELPTESYRAQMVTLTQDLAAGLLNAKVAARLTRQAWDGVTGWLVENGPSFLVKVILFLVIVLGGRFVAGLISRLVEKSLDRAKLNMSNLLKRMTVTFTKNAISILALVFGLAQLGLSLGPLLAGFGVVGFILGFAMQDSLSNLAAGMMILINRPYDVGDLVEVSGVFGKVEQMSMVSTSVLTVDNQKLVVPNSKIWGDVIKNVTDQRIRRVDMTFGISYTDDIPHAETVLNAILAEHDKVLDDPEPMVRLHTLNESSVDFVVRPWVRTDDYWDIYWDVTRAVKMRFDEEDISIPFPQRDVHIYEEHKLTEEKGLPQEAAVEQGQVAKTGQEEPDVGEAD